MKFTADGGICVQVIADSISEQGVRLTTLALSYPRFFHSELMTHRLIAKNAASSRAIPIKNVIKQTSAKPLFWGQNKAGMSAATQLSGLRLLIAKSTWRLAATSARMCARIFSKVGLHKQTANRILEPFQIMTTLATATEWDNFFNLRIDANAQPEFKVLAETMYRALAESKPTLLHQSEWHLPYCTPEEKQVHSESDLIKMSVARCARVSYLKHDGRLPDINADLKLYDRLITSKPVHGSPTEHVATPAFKATLEPEAVTVLASLEQGVSHVTRDGRCWSGSLHGWKQYRKYLADEQFVGRFVL